MKARMRVIEFYDLTLDDVKALIEIYGDKVCVHVAEADHERRELTDSELDALIETIRKA